jgi:hypothetical protein
VCDKHRFIFNLALAYRVQAVEQFDSSPLHSILDHGAPDELGVYALYLDKHGKQPVYVGKASGIKLARRLTEHAKKIAARQNIDVNRVRCRYLVIGGAGEEWVASAAEGQLIAHYEPKWNRSGFGGHVPGGGRPGIRAVPWDTWYPPKK